MENEKLKRRISLRSRDRSLRNKSKSTNGAFEQENSMDEKDPLGDIFFCKKCEFTTDHKFLLNRHMLKTHYYQKKACPKCGHKVNNLSTHLKRSHGIDRPHKCPIERCKASFETRAKKLTHIETKHGANPFVCPRESCSMTFSKEHQLKSHLTFSHTTKEDKCPFCGERLSSACTLRQHIERCQVVTNMGPECSYCGFRADGKVEMKNHLKAEHLDEGDKYVCDLCSYTTLRKAQIGVHFKLVHLRDHPRRCCQFCSFSASTKWELRAHLELEHSTKRKHPLKCVDCDFETRKKTEMAQHQRKNHKGQRRARGVQRGVERPRKNRKRYNCNDCEFFTVYPYKLTLHKKETGHKGDEMPPLRNGLMLETLRNKVGRPPLIRAPAVTVKEERLFEPEIKIKEEPLIQIKEEPKDDYENPPMVVFEISDVVVKKEEPDW